jgi:two-component system, sensor histidine kinase and response regulator
LDTGIGIQEKNQPNLFKLFSTIRSKTQKNLGGIGLGLCICKGLIDKFSGEILFKSKPGEGNTFMFTYELNVLEDQEEKLVDYIKNEKQK